MLKNGSCCLRSFSLLLLNASLLLLNVSLLSPRRSFTLHDTAQVLTYPSLAPPCASLTVPCPALPYPSPPLMAPWHSVPNPPCGHLAESARGKMTQRGPDPISLGGDNWLFPMRKADPFKKG